MIGNAGESLSSGRARGRVPDTAGPPHYGTSYAM